MLLIRVELLRIFLLLLFLCRFFFHKFVKVNFLYCFSRSCSLIYFVSRVFFTRVSSKNNYKNRNEVEQKRKEGKVLNEENLFFSFPPSFFMGTLKLKFSRSLSGEIFLNFIFIFCHLILKINQNFYNHSQKLHFVFLFTKKEFISKISFSSFKKNLRNWSFFFILKNGEGVGATFYVFFFSWRDTRSKQDVDKDLTVVMTEDYKCHFRWKSYFCCCHCLFV